MSKRLPVFLLACAITSAQAATINEVISPASLVVAGEHSRDVISLDGAPVYYCGLSAFLQWAAPLTGQSIESAPDTGISVSVDSRRVSLQRLLVERGWLQPATLDDEAQAAITEGRGGWACATAQKPFELMRTSVDARVLAGIALNESGLNGRAWPWTLNVAGRSFYFRSREDAYRAVTSLLSRQRCDFDVGIMQINWCYHRSRFASPWDALAPATNIHVAEDILNENYQKTGSVAKAVSRYHNANPVPGRAYLSRFLRHLNQIEAGL